MISSNRMGGRIGAAALLGGAVMAASCFDSGARWRDPPATTTSPPPPACSEGAQRCAFGRIERCEEGSDGRLAWATVEDCGAEGRVCSSKLMKCTHCLPDEMACDGQDVILCHSDGEGSDLLSTCDPGVGEACRDGFCQNLCQVAAIERSNVGCEYWAVDLDNAMIDAADNAAAQQFAVVVSNVQPDVATEVRIYQDDGEPGDPAAPVEIAAATIAPYNLQVFKLGPREVDGSPIGEYNTGTGTALTRHAFKVVTSFPIVAYQFNPLDNVAVFSNDATLLKPREALTSEGNELTPAYVVAGWPQTIAATSDPNTNFNPSFPINLRAFLTIVGTMPGTTVRVRPTAAVIPGGPVKATLPGGVIEQKLDAFDVLNLETGDFNADFTGTVIEADGPIAVFSGSEASDAPHFDTLALRRCCADHLEDQLDPLRTAGKTFAIAHSPSRTAAVKAAGADIEAVPEPDYVRFIAATDQGAVIKTTLAPPDDEIVLKFRGDFEEVTVYGDFMAESDNAIHVSQVMASQDAAGVKRGLPGGDPSLLVEPPIEQFRPDYVFLTPDKYVFDFVSIVAPPGAQILFDDSPLDTLGCSSAPADGLTAKERGSPDPPWVVYTCQLGFPSINALTSPPTVTPGLQNDGVHRIVADQPIGVVVSGFDSYVSYAYAGGTDLRTLEVPK